MLKDQSELLEVLNAHSVEYVVVGGHAVGAHGVSRLTKDMDILLRNSPENGAKAYCALAAYGAPLGEYSVSDFSGHPRLVIQFGVPPARIDVLQELEGVDTEEVFVNRVMFPINENLSAPFISLNDLLRNKDSVARLQDLADAEKLRKVARKS